MESVGIWNKLTLDLEKAFTRFRLSVRNPGYIVLSEKKVDMVCMWVSYTLHICCHCGYLYNLLIYVVCLHLGGLDRVTLVLANQQMSTECSDHYKIIGHAIRLQGLSVCRHSFIKCMIVLHCGDSVFKV